MATAHHAPRTTHHTDHAHHTSTTLPPPNHHAPHQVGIVATNLLGEFLGGGSQEGLDPNHPLGGSLPPPTIGGGAGVGGGVGARGGVMDDLAFDMNLDPVSCTELRIVARSYTELHGVTHSCTELHGVRFSTPPQP